jgi:cytochrome c-type biogenesis protein CcmH/NrfG
MRDKLEALLASGQDSANLRFALASACFADGDAERAILHAGFAVQQKPDYSAAWRLLGQAQVVAGRTADAAVSFERGIQVAEQAGDRQVGKEMQVFLRRLQNKAES